MVWEGARETGPQFRWMVRRLLSRVCDAGVEWVLVTPTKRLEAIVRGNYSINPVRNTVERRTNRFVRLLPKQSAFCIETDQPTIILIVPGIEQQSDRRTGVTSLDACVPPPSLPSTVRFHDRCWAVAATGHKSIQRNRRRQTSGQPDGQPARVGTVPNEIIRNCGPISSGLLIRMNGLICRRTIVIQPSSVRWSN